MKQEQPITADGQDIQMELHFANPMYILHSHWLETLVD